MSRFFNRITTLLLLPLFLLYQFQTALLHKYTILPQGWENHREEFSNTPLVAFWHPKFCHPINCVQFNLDFGDLSLPLSCRETIPYNGFVTEHERFGERPPVIANLFFPFRSPFCTKFVDSVNRPVSRQKAGNWILSLHMGSPLRRDDLFAISIVNCLATVSP